MTHAAGAQTAASPLTTHFWHGVEALAFLLICVGGIAIGEWRQRRRANRAATTEPTASRPPRSGRRLVAMVARIRGNRAPQLLVTAALSCAGAATIHFVVMPEHFEEAVLYGWFFLVTATAQIIYSALLVARPSRSLLIAGLAANTAVVVLWLSSRLIEIPLGPGAGSREPFGGLDILASGFEVLFIISAALTLAGELPAPRRVWPLMINPAAVAATMTAIAAIAVTASLYPPS